MRHLKSLQVFGIILCCGCYHRGSARMNELNGPDRFHEVEAVRASNDPNITQKHLTEVAVFFEPLQLPASAHLQIDIMIDSRRIIASRNLVVDWSGRKIDWFVLALHDQPTMEEIMDASREGRLKSRLTLSGGDANTRFRARYTAAFCFNAPIGPPKYHSGIYDPPEISCNPGLDVLNVVHTRMDEIR